MAAGAETLVGGAVPLNRDDDEVGTKKWLQGARGA